MNILLDHITRQAVDLDNDRPIPTPDSGIDVQISPVEPIWGTNERRTKQLAYNILRYYGASEWQAVALLYPFSSILADYDMRHSWHLTRDENGKVVVTPAKSRINLVDGRVLLMDDVFKREGFPS